MHPPASLRQPTLHRPALLDPFLVQHGVVHDGPLVRGKDQVNFFRRASARLLGRRNRKDLQPHCGATARSGVYAVRERQRAQISAQLALALFEISAAPDVGYGKFSVRFTPSSSPASSETPALETGNPRDSPHGAGASRVWSSGSDRCSSDQCSSRPGAGIPRPCRL
jgi:hypothetical protein